MKIRKINLYTNRLQPEKEFYTNVLGFDLIHDESTFFTVRVGWSDLSFTLSSDSHTYHYCFLVPSNQLHESLLWMQQRTDIIDIDNGRKIQHFDSWNADSFYFYDASGNLAEFIVRYDLENDSSNKFQSSSVLGFNEIGMPTTHVGKTNGELERLFGTLFWKGDIERFGTNGDQEGMFLLPNYEIKDKWFPTDQTIHPEPFEAVIEHKGKESGLTFINGNIRKEMPEVFMDRYA